MGRVRGRLAATANGATTVEFSCNYTKLTGLSFLYCFVVMGNLISAKSFPPVGIEPATFSSQCLSICARSPSVNSVIFNLTFVCALVTFGLRGTERI